MQASRYRISSTIATLAAALPLLAAAPCLSQNYPARAIRMVVGFPPGGMTDVFARQIGERAAADLGRQVVVDRWATLVRQLQSQRDFAERIEALGGQIAKPNTPEEFTAFIERDMNRWAKIIKAANLRIE